MLELGWDWEGCRSAAGRPISAHLPCLSPKKAEQDIEMWKKQEAAAKEAESGSPGSENQPEVMVPQAPLSWWGTGLQPHAGCGVGRGKAGPGEGGEEREGRFGVQWEPCCSPRTVPTAAAHPESQATADGHDRRAEEEADGEGATYL